MLQHAQGSACTGLVQEKHGRVMYKPRWSVEPTHAHPGVKCLEPACRCTCVASVLLHAQVGVADRVVCTGVVHYLFASLEASEHQHAEAVRHVRALNGRSCPQATAVARVCAVTSCWLHTQGLWKHRKVCGPQRRILCTVRPLFSPCPGLSVYSSSTAVYRHVCY
jgi:hypothetical protein